MTTAANDNLPADAPQELTFFSVCSGIEAASVAWHPLGWKCVGVSEIEKFPSAVLAHHYPDVPNHGDFTKVDVKTLPYVDIFCGGTPCQAFSVAGLRNSLADARGNLSLEFVRLAHELADNNGLRNAVWENVPGVLSTKDNAYGCFLGGLVGADDAVPPPAGRWWPDQGMVAGPKGRAAWAILDAQFFGLAQRRRRVILVADFGTGADPAAVLFELYGVQGNTPPSREAGKDVAPTISARTKGGGRGVERTGDTRGQDPVVAVSYAPEIERCVATREGSSQDYETTTMVAHAIQAGAMRTNPSSYGKQPDSSDTALGPNLIAQTVAIRGREGGGTAELGGEVATALRASSGGGDKPHVLAPIAFNAEAQADQLPGAGRDTSINDGLTVAQRAAVATTSAVRRLTPVECERLQGFPDNYTNIPWRGKPASPDGPRYKALGNSWAVPKFAWLGRRIARLMPAATTTRKDAE